MRHHTEHGECSGAREPCCGGHGMGRGHGHGWRRYVSPEEERELIEQYTTELEKEIAGAKARLDELK